MSHFNSHFVDEVVNLVNWLPLCNFFPFHAGTYYIMIPPNLLKLCPLSSSVYLYHSTTAFYQVSIIVVYLSLPFLSKYITGWIVNFVRFCRVRSEQIRRFASAMVQLIRWGHFSEMARAGLSGSRHVIGRSGRIGLARAKRTVKVIAYRLFHSPAKTCVKQWQTTLPDNALHCSTLWISASSNANPICLSWKKRYMNNRPKYMTNSIAQLQC